MSTSNRRQRAVLKAGIATFMDTLFELDEVLVLDGTRPRKFEDAPLPLCAALFLPSLPLLLRLLLLLLPLALVRLEAADESIAESGGYAGETCMVLRVVERRDGDGERRGRLRMSGSDGKGDGERRAELRLLRRRVCASLPVS